ncbi:MAG: hypothetical protein A3F83_13285 [Candidatus Glassbacteria bacterium RIFCSPLOWO2_12_FULL_58_11]|uniref:NAD-dependent epimerase/dehydratase domain-containing protein n=2 Tax=Candidatus Glassiibacteriota TaxID=1817805 RepID=A0A1F5YTQ5_9BACT|nr:MAG: hypothetical protein A3F83_13285 [Candidatus Glassbacteria bacterium RIFCSPLOWO2_12_FULL_58_11]
MPILVTGATGYIGSAIAEYFADLGRAVLIVTRDRTRRALLEGPERFTVAEGDLQNAGFVERIFEQFHPECVIHAAWEGLSHEDRDSAQQVTNLAILENLLKAAVSTGTETFVGLGSQAEYGVYNTRIEESFWPRPEERYGVYKLAAGLLGERFASRTELRFAWLRLFSSFGPRDHDYFLLPLVIRSLLAGKSPELSSCEQVWDYLYVKDIPRLIELVLNADSRFCGSFNLCSGVPVKLKEVVNALSSIIGEPAEPLFGVLPQRKNRLSRLEGDNRKFQDTFGWCELTPLSLALVETVTWYRGR